MFPRAFEYRIFAALGCLCLFTGAAVACGSDSAGPDPGAAATDVLRAPAGRDGEAEKAAITVRPDRSYTLDDLVSAGWKKSKDFGVETLPGATQAAFGFYNQRDIEVWVYPSHADAVKEGVGPAEQAIARKPGQTDYLIPVVNRYFAYAVVGNLVLLCEHELADCQALIAKLP